MVSEEREFNPFPGLAATYNGVTAQYPERAELWKAKAAPARYNSTYEAEDQDRRLVASLNIPACPYRGQVQRLMRAYIEEERRFRRHQITLPPDAAILEPLDSLAWSSTVNGYIDKVFEVAGLTDDMATVLQRVQARERDPEDYDWVPNFHLPVNLVSHKPVTHIAQTVPGWDVDGISLPGAGGAPRRPALKVAWDPIDLDDVRGLYLEFRVTGTSEVIRRTAHDVEAGLLHHGRRGRGHRVPGARQAPGEPAGQLDRLDQRHHTRDPLRRGRLRHRHGQPDQRRV